MIDLNVQAKNCKEIIDVLINKKEHEMDVLTYAIHSIIEATKNRRTLTYYFSTIENAIKKDVRDSMIIDYGLELMTAVFCILGSLDNFGLNSEEFLLKVIENAQRELKKYSLMNNKELKRR